jgi:hypothetical protein
MHCLATGAIAAAAYLMLAGTPLLPPLRDQRRSITVTLTLTIGLTIGVLWEFVEWFFLDVLSVQVGVGYTDTIADLAMDTLGSLLAGVALVAWIAWAGVDRLPESARAAKSGPQRRPGSADAEPGSRSDPQRMNKTEGSGYPHF